MTSTDPRRSPNASRPPSPDRPSPFPWPPVLLALAIGGALAFDWLIVPLPVPFAETALVQVLGWMLLLGGIAVSVWAALAFRAHNTTIRPDRGADALIEDGPYAWSRNPIYLGEVAALIGAALAFNRLTFLIAAPLFAFAVDRLAIRREETYLARRFGEAYQQYTARTRRWL